MTGQQTTTLHISTGEALLFGVIAVVILALILDGLLLLVGRLTTSRGIHV